MTDFTRPATWDDVATVIRLLEESGVDYALIGGYALAVHGFYRFSEDVDILVDPDPVNTARWIAALSRLPDGAARELEPEPDLFQREGHYCVRINDEFTVDVLPAACGHAWEELKQWIVRRRIGDQPIRVLDLQGLLLTKEGGRDRDRADAAVIREALRRPR